jgi:hypothetical protein
VGQSKESGVKKIQSGQGVTDLGSQMSEETREGRPGEIVNVLSEAVTTPNGRNETVDRSVPEGTPDRKVTFIGAAADEYRRAKADGLSDDSAFIHAERVQKLLKHTCTPDTMPNSDCVACFADPKNWHPVEGSFLTRPPTVTEVDEVNHPSHYTSHSSGIECLEIARWMMFDIGNALKYVMREEYKGQSRKDAEKARVYLEDALGNCDRIWGMLDMSDFGDKVDEAKKKLFGVAETEPDFVKSMFYHALYEDRPERALQAVNALLERHGLIGRED